MNPNVNFSGSRPQPDRWSMRWTTKPRYIAFLVIVGSLTGCAGSVAMQNPQTGVTAICRGSLHEFNPWAQTMACVANYEAQGWVRTGQE